MINKLKEILAQDDAVIFVGSGISLWSGLPTWSGLIELLANFIEAEGGDASLVRTEAINDLLQAASYGFNKLTKPQIGKFIKSACQYGTVQPHEIHQLICELGPRCFVTTNYDNLLEQALVKWQPDIFYPTPVTNRHLTEIAEIVSARAKDYIFKPHGDAGDIESIVLTKEQYRELLPQGGKYSALETLKTIMATRPIIYLGFGLRDPDFLYLKDLLANTYAGGARDHYAIMQDVVPEQLEYWQKYYGLHLVSYSTLSGETGLKRHAGLITLLRQLGQPKPSNRTETYATLDSNTILSLARYAGGLTRMPKLASEFKIRVQLKSTNKGDYSYIRNSFDHQFVEKFLISGPATALLIGFPGAGKTYALKRASADLAEILQEQCLLDNFPSKETIVPFYIDFKLYQGNINALIAKLLPPALSFETIAKEFKVKLFFDSFNEMPKEYWESGSYEADLENFLKENRSASIIIGSRTTDGLDKLGYLRYDLNHIDQDIIIKELEKKDISFKGTFRDEILKLLSRPFYFHYVLNGTVSLQSNAQPKDFYIAYFQNLQKAFTEKFNLTINIELLLSTSAYNTLNKGEEVFAVADLQALIRTKFSKENVINVSPVDTVNWLIAKSIIIPYSGGRISFVHQSLTEYLASTQLAREYSYNHSVLQEKLSLTRWDQTLFLTLSFLDNQNAKEFLQETMSIDLGLAMNAAKYMESDNEQIVSKLLTECINRAKTPEASNWRVTSALGYHLPVTKTHVSQLKSLLTLSENWASSAAECLIRLLGHEIKDELLDLFLRQYDNFNLGISIGSSLAIYANETDLIKILEWCDLIDAVKEDEKSLSYDTFTYGISQFIRKLPIEIIRRHIIKLSEDGSLSSIRAQIACYTLYHIQDSENLKFAAELLEIGVKKVITSISFMLDEDESIEQQAERWKVFTKNHIDIIIKGIGDNVYSATESLATICSTRPDLAEYVKSKALVSSGMERAILFYCLDENDLTFFVSFLEDMVTKPVDEKIISEVEMMKNIHIDWAEKAELFLKIIKIRESRIINAIFPGVIPADFENLAELEIIDIEWWLDWIEELCAIKDGYWPSRQLGCLLVRYGTTATKSRVLTEFNKKDSKYRETLEKCVLEYLPNLTTDDLSEDAVSYLFSSLRNDIDLQRSYDSLLAKTATEKFIAERVIPLLSNSSGALLQGLKQIAIDSGNRHGKRYVAN